MADEKDPIVEKVRQELKSHRGVFIGEAHYQPAFLKWMASHMADFKAAGVTKLYIEQVTAERQEYLDNYMDGMPGAAEALQYKGLGAFNSPGYFEVLKAAKEAGIKITGIDHDTIARGKEKGLEGISYNREGMDYRQSVSNPFWKKIVKGDLADATPEDKYIIWGGAGHSNRESGIDKMLGIPSIDVYDAVTLQLGRGTFDNEIPEQAYDAKKPAIYADKKAASYVGVIPGEQKHTFTRAQQPFTEEEFKVYSALTFGLNAKTLTPKTRKELEDVVRVLATPENSVRENSKQLEKEISDLAPNIPEMNMTRAKAVITKTREGR